MKIIKTIKGKSIIRAAARRSGVPLDVYRKELETAIDAAWNSSDPVVRNKQKELFPDGKPTAEIFIMTIAGQIGYDSNN